MKVKFIQLATLVLFTYLYSSTSLALHYLGYSQKLEGRKVVFAMGEIEENERFPNLNYAEPTFIIIVSDGGSTTGKDKLISALNRATFESEKAGHPLYLGFTGTCGSACTSILAWANNYSKALPTLLHVFADAETMVMFHGAYINGVRDENETLSSLKTLIQWGIDRKWEMEHLSYFSQSSIKDETANILITKPELRDAGFTGEITILPENKLKNFFFKNSSYDL